MKKKTLCWLLTICTIVTQCTIFVHAETDTKSITFRDIPWYSTKTETESILFADGAKESGWMSSPNNIYRMSGINFRSSTSGSDRVDGGGYMGWYSGVSVAGYDVADTYVCYIYPFDENGNIIRSDDDAQLYFGWYSFGPNDCSDHRAIYDDLVTKLTSLYSNGTSETDDYRSSVTWYDNQNNQIHILINSDEDYVALGYITADADARLDEMQAALDAEAAANEAAEREANKKNVSGL